MTDQKHEDGGPAFPTDKALCDSLGMSLREYAAIHLRVPNSGKAWLDEMIEEANRNDFAAKALSGINANPQYTGSHDRSEIVYISVAFADAMLAERRKGKE